MRCSELIKNRVNGKQRRKHRMEINARASQWHVNLNVLHSKKNC